MSSDISSPPYAYSNLPRTCGCMLEGTYRSILGGFGLAALECHSVTLVLETLRGDETLDAGGLGVGFLAFALGLDFAADDEFADLVRFAPSDQYGIQFGLLRRPPPHKKERSSIRMKEGSESDENMRIRKHSRRHPCPTQRTCESSSPAWAPTSSATPYP